MIEDQIPVEEPTQEPAKHHWTIWLAGAGCAVLLCSMIFVGVMVVIGPDFIQQFIPGSGINPVDSPPRVSAQGNTMGDPEAPVHIVEYGDFQCPYCVNFWKDTEPQLIEEYVSTGKVYFEYRSLGAFLGEESGWAAEGTYCAGDQNRFWEFHDVLYANWVGKNVGNYSRERLVEFAKTIDMDAVEFEACLREGRHKATVEQDAADGLAAGVRATPTFFINGVKVEGAQPFEVFKELIEDALNGNFNISNG